MYKKKPFLIVFEGVEGCGKSYQSQKLIRSLKKKGINPTKNLIGLKISSRNRNKGSKKAET